MIQPDYSLLRPIQVEELEIGDAIFSVNHNQIIAFIAGPDASNRVCCERNKNLVVVNLSCLFVNPICWIEGKPVYKGDKLYYISSQNPSFSGVFAVECKGHTDKELFLDGGGWVYISDLTWVMPKTKKEGWMNIYPNNRVHPEIFTTKEDADKSAYSARIDCIKTEWME